MNLLPCSLRSSAVAASTAAALLLLTAPAALAAGGSAAEVEVDHDCTSIDVSSSMDISNVVLQFEDGTQRFEDLPERRTGTFAGTGDNSGEVITTAWIKSGANFSGDGPGYGERFDFEDDLEDCASDSQTTGTTGTTNDDDQGQQGDDGPQDPQGGDGPQGDDGPEGDQDATVSDTTGDGSDGDGGSEADDDATNDSDNSDDAAGSDGELPAPRVLSGVLTATAEREAAGEVRSADASEIRSAGLLPNTGADVPVALAAALGALALGGGLLRRTRHGGA